LQSGIKKPSNCYNNDCHKDWTLCTSLDINEGWETNMLKIIGVDDIRSMAAQLGSQIDIYKLGFFRHFTMGMQCVGAALFSLTLAGCAATKETKNANGDEKTAVATEHGSPSSSDIEKKITETVVSPLSDLNLVRAEISPVLSAAIKAPYALMADKSCEAIANEVRALDLALGPDLDASVGVEPNLIAKGTTELEKAAIGALSRTVDGAIPFRSWVRKFSGAEKHSRDVATALAAGIVRRSFLKGLGQASGCQAPAAPRQQVIVNKQTDG
jgi:hypothetical protein